MSVAGASLLQVCCRQRREADDKPPGLRIVASRRMRSRHTLLTHFSQRYPKNPLSTVSPLDPWLSAEDKAFAQTQVVALASDFVSVAIGDMWKLPLYTDAIAALFEEQQDDEGSDSDSATGKNVVSADGGAGQSKVEKRAARKAANAATRPTNDGGAIVTRPAKDAGATSTSGVEFGLKPQATGEKQQPRSKKARSNQPPRKASPRRTSGGHVSPRAKAAVDLPSPAPLNQAAAADVTPAAATGDKGGPL